MLTKFWNTALNGSTPIAYELKNEFTERWGRFHSLPEAKRYSDSELEYQVIFSRHNQLLSQLCSTDNTVYMIAPEYSCLSKPRELGDELEGIFDNPNYWQTIPLHEPDENNRKGFYWHLYFEKINWLPDSVDGLFRLVTDEKAFNVMIVSPSLGWIFHPYDGGADLILKSNQEMLRVKKNFRTGYQLIFQGLSINKK
jgi:hypothetical protein